MEALHAKANPTADELVIPNHPRTPLHPPGRRAHEGRQRGRLEPAPGGVRRRGRVHAELAPPLRRGLPHAPNAPQRGVLLDGATATGTSPRNVMGGGPKMRRSSGPTQRSARNPWRRWRTLLHLGPFLLGAGTWRRSPSPRSRCRRHRRRSVGLRSRGWIEVGSATFVAKVRRAGCPPIPSESSSALPPDGLIHKRPSHPTSGDSGVCESGKRDLNPRPPPWQGGRGPCGNRNLPESGEHRRAG